MTRYPGTAEPVTESEYREALAAAEAVVIWAEEVVGYPPKPVPPLPEI